MAGRKIIVEFLGKDTSLSRTARSAGDETDKLGKRMGAVGKVGALALAAGAVVAAKGLYEMGEAAAEDQQAAAMLAKQLRNSAGATKGQVAETEKWITAQGKALGVSDDQLRPSLSKLVVATGDVGKAQKLAALAMDASAGTGKDLGTVSAALAKAQNGNVGALGRLGIATKDASGKALTFDQIQKNMAKTFGGAASEKANTLQGKIDRLKLIFSETGETIGAKLLPVVTKLADWFLNKGIPAISQFSTFLQDRLGPAIEKIRAIFSGSTSGMSGDVSKHLQSIKDIFTSVISIITSLWNRFGPGLLAAIVPAFNAIRAIVGGQLTIIAGIFKTVAALLKGDWQGVWNGLKQIVSGAWTVIKGFVSLGWNAIKLIFRTAGAALKSIFVGIWNGIKSLASAGFNGLISLVKSIPGRLRSIAGSFGSAGKALINAFVNGLKNAGGVIKGLAGNVWAVVKGMLNRAIQTINNGIPNSVGKGALKISFPANPIPRLATGGIVKARRGGTLAILGEGGADEAVIPLSGKHAPRGMSSGDGDIYITINGALDPGAVAKQVHQMLVKRKRETGMALGLT